jgi:hypothetical protein
MNRERARPKCVDVPWSIVTSCRVHKKSAAVRPTLSANGSNPTASSRSKLLARWETGMVTDRRERRMAARLAAERAALPLPDPSNLAAAIAGLPTLAAITGPGGHDEEEVTAPDPVPPDPGDDDDDEEIFDAPEGDDFYDDAFGVIE